MQELIKSSKRRQNNRWWTKCWVSVLSFELECHWSDLSMSVSLVDAHTVPSTSINCLRTQPPETTDHWGSWPQTLQYEDKCWSNTWSPVISEIIPCSDPVPKPDDLEIRSVEDWKAFNLNTFVAWRSDAGGHWWDSNTDEQQKKKLLYVVNRTWLLRSYKLTPAEKVVACSRWRDRFNDKDYFAGGTKIKC